MRKFEYIVVNMSEAVDSRFGTSNRDYNNSVTMILNELGNNGWELVMIDTKYTGCFIFKREK